MRRGIASISVSVAKDHPDILADVTISRRHVVYSPAGAAAATPPVNALTGMIMQFHFTCRRTSVLSRSRANTDTRPPRSTITIQEERQVPVDCAAPRHAMVRRVASRQDTPCSSMPHRPPTRYGASPWDVAPRLAAPRRTASRCAALLRRAALRKPRAARHLAAPQRTAPRCGE